MESPETRWSRGTIFFIILTMAKDGPVYGNQIANLISERTDGAWKPGSGSIYPALKRLEHRGLIEKREEGGKVLYSLTEKGSALISKIKDGHFERSPVARLMGRIWMEALNPHEMMRFMISSAKHTNEYLDTNLKNIRNNLGNSKEFEVFLMSYELEFERSLKILKNARQELVNEQEEKE